MDFNRNLNSGGADGCIDFTDPDNAGLKGCMLSTVTERDSSNVSLEGMYQQFCKEVSVADFFVITAEALMTATAPPGSLRNMWRSSFVNNFRFGRTTALTCNPEPLPNPADGCDAVGDVFIDRMGLDGTEAAALMGVHTLGRALTENSGYDGFWVSQDHARTFNTEYFTRIIAVGWRTAIAPSGKAQWIRADVAPGTPLSGEMMLNTDMCLAYQSGLTAPFTRAEDKNHTNCCLWMKFDSSDMQGVECGCQGQDISIGCTELNCCIRSIGGCRGNNPFRRFVRNDAWRHSTSTLNAVVKYAKKTSGNVDWNKDFMRAWGQTTVQGHDMC